MLAVSGINFASKNNFKASSNNQQPRIKMHSQPIQDCISFCGLPANFGEVIKGKLFRSAKPDDFKALLDKGIKYVVDLRDGLERASAPEQALVEGIGMEYHTAPAGFSDLMPNNPTFLQTNKALAEKIQGFMDRNDGAVLVHCSKGEMRTGRVIAAYQHYLQKLPVAEIIKHAEKYENGTPFAIKALTRLMQTMPVE